MAGGISLHAVDVAHGVPAAGMRVQIFRRDGDTLRALADAVLESGGQLSHPIVSGAGVEPGTHEAWFHLGEWWRSREQSSTHHFQEVAVFRFEVLSLTEHYHLPIKFTPWGFALFRGA